MATFSATIAASSDDAREDAGTSVITGTNLTMDTSTRYGGLRFLNVTIPQGSTVSAATLNVTLPSLAHDSPDVTIWCEDVDDAATFTTAANNVSGRTATSATTTWVATDIGTGVKTSPDFAAAVQEVINRAGWVSGNDLAVILKGNSVNSLRFNAYDGGGSDYATINITYTTGGGGGQPMVARGRIVPGMRRQHGRQGW